MAVDCGKFSSEYRRRFTRHPIERLENFKPPPAPIQAEGSQDHLTTTRKHYVRHMEMPPKSFKMERTYEPGGEFHPISSYRREFKHKLVDPAKSTKKIDVHQNPGIFEGLPAYRLYYRPWEPPERVYREKEVWLPPVDDMEWSTTSRSYYQRYVVSPRKNFKPPNMFIKNEDPFDSKSMYGTNYVRHVPCPHLYRVERTVKPVEADPPPWI